MKRQKYKGPERREFVRLDYSAPLSCKVCKKETVAKILEGYTVNISKSGLLCSVGEKVRKNDILWLGFDRNALSFCSVLEKRALVYQNGIIGKVVRVELKDDGRYDIGIQFLTREEKNSTFIYSKEYFLEKQLKSGKT
ncbi:MAG: PilZ domain-containing protein [Candidatus Omnitrophica bacterium]|nr:PilZ domain-containing protein [Candidatus Omnitrophota bacterium]MBU1870382.1 PilZ domain-containing protein [Candidatus Omnitrophota bacterium]